MWRNRKPRLARELSAKEISTLVQAAQVSEAEIRGWHADFLEHYPSGRIDKKALIQYCQKLNPKLGTESSFEKIYDTIDVNNDGTIDFNELLVVLVLMGRFDDVSSQLAFAFESWDESGDGFINQSELADVIGAIYDCSGITDRKGERDPKQRAKEIIAKLDINSDQKLSKQEFITGCKNDPIIRDLLVRYG